MSQAELEKKKELKKKRSAASAGSAPTTFETKEGVQQKLQPTKACAARRTNSS
jgi:hypothetical protein